MSWRDAYRGLHVVTSREALAPCPFFRTGDRVPETGLYRVHHGDRRKVHEVTLLGGEIFPRCRVCGPVVHFDLLKLAPGIEQDADFRSRKLFELPHPEPGAA